MSAPTTVAAQEIRDDHGFPRYELREWKAAFGLTAGITAAHHETGTIDLALPPIGSDLGASWQALSSGVTGRFQGAVIGRQVHGSRVAVHGPPDRGTVVLDDTDGHLTSERGLLLVVTVADCIPLFFAAPEAGVIALAHAGWRGLAAGIVREMVGAFRDVGVSPDQVVMHCGVAICGDCYEVGPEVFEELGARPRPGHRTLDLRAVAADQAVNCGLERVSMSSWCSMHDSVFHSFRRDGAASGRMAAYLGYPLT